MHNQQVIDGLILAKQGRYKVICSQKDRSYLFFKVHIYSLYFTIIFKPSERSLIQE